MAVFARQYPCLGPQKGGTAFLLTLEEPSSQTSWRQPDSPFLYTTQKQIAIQC